MNIEKYLTDIIQKSVKEVVHEEMEDFKQDILHLVKVKNRKKQKNNTEYQSQIISPKELAQMLSLRISTLYGIQNEEPLSPKIRIGSKAVGWLKSDIEEWLMERKLPSKT